MKCPRCSFENAASSVSCRRCGQIINSASNTPLFSTENFGAAGVVSGQIVGDVHIHPSNSKSNYNGTLTFENAAPITKGIRLRPGGSRDGTARIKWDLSILKGRGGLCAVP